MTLKSPRLEHEHQQDSKRMSKVHDVHNQISRNKHLLCCMSPDATVMAGGNPPIMYICRGSLMMIYILIVAIQVPQRCASSAPLAAPDAV